MKRIATTLALFFVPCLQTLSGQAKHDYVWPLGYGEEYHSPTTGIVQGAILMDFNTSPPTFPLQSYLCDRVLAGTCDTSGRLLAYTDGCRIYNRDHELMPNGDTLNPGKVFNSFCEQGSYPLWQGFLFLPKPSSDHLYCLFHLRDDDQLWNPMDLMYSIVDAEGDGGKGRVVSKNQPVLSDSIWLGNYISATRHANGRDWWVVVPQRVRPGYHVSLLTPEGIAYKGLQVIGDSTDQHCCGQTAFSTDGSKYFKNWLDGLQILDFDRCTGLFSNPVYLDYTVVPNGAGGVAVSPSGQYLYLSAGYNVHQYDLWAADLVASRQTVAEYDGYVSPFATYFFQAMLAPDGKIYMISPNTNNILHVIHDPDAPGLACNVEQHGVTLPALTAYIMPNFANYRLYDLPGSPCDTLGINGPVVSAPEAQVEKEGLRLWPNPASGKVTISLPAGEPGQVLLTDLRGKVWIERATTAGAGQVDISTGHLPPGVYIVSFRPAAGGVASRKLVVQRA